MFLYSRSIYRIAEFADGYGGSIYSAEWAFYVFDTILIFIAFIIYVAMPLGPHFFVTVDWIDDAAKEKQQLQGLWSHLGTRRRASPLSRLYLTYDAAVSWIVVLLVSIVTEWLSDTKLRRVGG
ncbi:hypothetical protein IWW38_006557 [Coemansia aciculifera]|uniref:Uncharacterized protein n=1 Tax=Coemansia aciculifera TaxID=417176 RepID=A0ACC1LTD6_9FUNG|nr:hypothetical protein IWW38_006557 [Coemansia aciculifera]